MGKWIKSLDGMKVYNMSKFDNIYVREVPGDVQIVLDSDKVAHAIRGFKTENQAMKYLNDALKGE